MKGTLSPAQSGVATFTAKRARSAPRAHQQAQGRTIAPAAAQRLVFATADLAPPPGIGGPDNLLTSDTKGRPLTLTLPFPVDSEPYMGDLVDLLIDDTIIPGSQVTIADDSGDDITMTLAAADHERTGLHRINYQLTFVAAGNTESGPKDQTFKVDYDPPGHPDLANPDFPFEPTEGLTPDRLDANGDLPAHVFGYAGIAIDDRITVIIDGVEGSNIIIVDDIPSADKPIQVLYPKVMIDTLDDGPHDFGYRVEDRAGNKSPSSAMVTLTTLIKGYIGDLEAPLVPEGDGSLVDDADARSGGGVIVQIPANAKLNVNQTAVVYWGSTASDPVRIPSGTQDPVLSLVIPYGVVHDQWFATSNGGDQAVPVNVSYEVFQDRISAGKSPETAVDANLYLAGGGDPDPETPAHEALLAPTVKSSSGQENVIPIGDFAKDGTMVIPFLTAALPGPAVDAFIEGDVITVQYGAAAPFDHPVTKAEVDAKVDIEFPLTAKSIEDGATGTVSVTYTITRKIAGGDGSGTNLSLSPAQQVSVSSAGDLPGGGATLAAATWSNAGGKTTIGPVEARAGVDIQLVGYTNKKEGDVITVSLLMGPKFTHADGEAPIDPPRVASKVHTVGPTDAGESQPSTVTFLYAELMYFGNPPLTMHAHIDYKVRGAGTAIDVGSQMLYVPVDCRGDEP